MTDTKPRKRSGGDRAARDAIQALAAALAALPGLPSGVADLVARAKAAADDLGE